MPDIIEVDLSSPWVRPNFKFIVKKMEEGAVLIIHDLKDATSVVKSLTRKKYTYGYTTEPNNTWKIFIKGTEDSKDDIAVYNDEKYDAIYEHLNKGETLTNKNIGELMVIMKIYKKRFPKSKQKIVYKKGKSGYALWLE